MRLNAYSPLPRPGINLQRQGTRAEGTPPEDEKNEGEGLSRIEKEKTPKAVISELLQAGADVVQSSDKLSLSEGEAWEIAGDLAKTAETLRQKVNSKPEEPPEPEEQAE